MPYADTDFFIALLNVEDRLNSSARRVYEEHKGRIFTSLAVVIEVILISRKFNISAKRLVEHILDTARIENTVPETLFSAASYIDEQKLSTFDAFHAAMCNHEIISSDRVYDKLGIKRIEL